MGDRFKRKFVNYFGGIIINKACCLLLFNSKNELLLQHRDNNAKYFKGFWGLIGGAVKADESIDDCIIRECFEETFLSIEVPHLLFSVIDHCIEYVYSMQIKDAPIIICGEGLEMQFVNINDINKYNISTYHKKIIMQALKCLERNTELYNNEKEYNIIL